MTLPGFDYRTRSPTGSLRRAVERVWYARGTVPHARERVAPTGSTVAILVLGDAIRQTADDGGGTPRESATGLLIWPHDRPIINEPTSETHAVGVVTKPVGARASLDLDPAGHRGDIDDLLGIWPVAEHLRERLRVSDDPDAMLDVVLAHLGTSLDFAVSGIDRCEAAVALLEADPTRSVSTVAAEPPNSAGTTRRTSSVTPAGTPASPRRPTSPLSAPTNPSARTFVPEDPVQPMHDPSKT